MSTKSITLALATLLVTVLTGCDNFLDITPTGKVIAKTYEEYRALLTYEYKFFPEDRGLATLRTDEMTLDKASTTAEDYDSYFDIWAWKDNAPSATTVSFGWRRYYHAIYIANYIIAHQKEITNASAEDISQLTGEAYMMRAYAHFLLANLYAEPYTHCSPETTRGVPVQLQHDVNSIPLCSSLSDLYRQILADIDVARRHLNVEQWKTGINYRFNTVSADALKARVCLYMGNWQEALAASEAVLAKRGQLEDMTASNSVLPDHYTSVENIVALEQVMTNVYKNIGRPSNELISLYRTGDMRKSKYYKQVTASVSSLRKGGSNEYCCTFRTAEFYLTAAEAAVELGNTAQAANYLIKLMEKRYTANALSALSQSVSTMDKETLRREIFDERKRELAFEGFLWYDLRRTTRPAIEKNYDGVKYLLNRQDARYTMRFPTEAVEANPGLEVWPNP